MKMKFLPKITQKDREIYITNLEFSELYLNKKTKRFLYASTASLYIIMTGIMKLKKI